MNEGGAKEEDATAYYRRLQAARKAPKANTETRLALIVAARGISDKELQRFRGKRANSKTFNYHAFAKKYRVSLDWLFDGDLRGLREMARGCPSRPQQPRRSQLQEFKEAVHKLDNERLSKVLEYASLLAAELPR
jgi:hypothetical protein